MEEDRVGKALSTFPWSYWGAGAGFLHPALASGEGGGAAPGPLTGAANTHLHARVGEELTCLNLGKRQYVKQGGCGGSGGGEAVVAAGKRGRFAAMASAGSPVAVPRCQVEGCHVALTDAKDYYRRHKVCEVHSKAFMAVVLGLHQRFCQQCSRFHVVSEFDDSKRSCRRRLAGHNERRRKSANEFLAKNFSQDNLMDGRLPSMPLMTGCALSLLSSKAPWISSADLSSRSSDALRELIAENRATILARQLSLDADFHHAPDRAGGAPSSLAHVPEQQRLVTERPEGSLWLPSWNHFHEPTVHLTLDLMQAPESSFQFIAGSRPKEEEECCELWRSIEGTHMV